MSEEKTTKKKPAVKAVENVAEDINDPKAIAARQAAAAKRRPPKAEED